MSQTDVSLCEHGEIEAACLDCFAKPKKLAPQKRVTQRTTKSPVSGNDMIAPFTGALDMSLPVDTADDHLGSTHLPAKIFPHHLKRGGWVYLRCDGHLKGRVKAKKMVWSEERAEMLLEVDPATWDDEIEIPLGELTEKQTTGYRYLVTNDDDSVTHYMGGKPVVFADPDDEDD